MRRVVNDVIQHMTCDVVNCYDTEKTDLMACTSIKKVMEVRESELRAFPEMNVYQYFRGEEAQSRRKIMGVRWAVSLKWDTVWSTTVAQETASGDRDDDAFRGQPVCPL